MIKIIGKNFITETEKPSKKCKSVTHFWWCQWPFFAFSKPLLSLLSFLISLLFSTFCKFGYVSFGRSRMGDRMFLGMQDFDFWPNQFKFCQILFKFCPNFTQFTQIYPNFIQIFSNFSKICPNFPKLA